jgi:hypothetical protein
MSATWGSGETVFLGRETPITHSRNILPDGCFRVQRLLGKITHEPGNVPGCQADGILQHQYLPIAITAGSDANDGYLNRFSYAFRQSRRHTFKQ